LKSASHKCGPVTLTVLLPNQIYFLNNLKDLHLTIATDSKIGHFPSWLLVFSRSHIKIKH